VNSVATNDQTLSMRAASVAFVVSGAVGDPEGTRTVSSIIALLVALGLALVMLAVWLHRATRPDPEVLAPLEVMGERKWRRSDPVWQRRRLDEIRPRGAVPMEPSIAPPALDAAFDKGPSAPGFDDLHGAGIASEGAGQPIGSDVDDLAPPSAGGRVEGEDTPPALKRPADDEFETDGVDPDLLAAAMAELDAELGQDRT
jgi:hypothetical protein